MRKIKCELCGQRDLLKEGSRFVCQSCGAAYSADQLRRQFDLADRAEIYAEAKQAYWAKRFKQARQLYLALAEEGDQQAAFYAGLAGSQLDPAADFTPLLSQLRAALAASREKGGEGYFAFASRALGEVIIFALAVLPWQWKKNVKKTFKSRLSAWNSAPGRPWRRPTRRCRKK